MATLRIAVYTLVVLSIIAIGETNARQIRQAPNTKTIKSSANLSLDELVYILKARNGVAVKPRQLTPCARAILSCCSDNVMNVSCSETLDCGAHFFDDNPCDEKFLRDALNNAKSFYEQFQQDNTVNSN